MKEETVEKPKDICPMCHEECYDVVMKKDKWGGTRGYCQNPACQAEFTYHNSMATFSGAMSKFRCFACNAKIEAPTEYAGRKGRCPKCKANNTIPSMHDTLDETIMMMFQDIEDKEDEECEKKYDLQREGSYTDDDGGNLPNG